MAAPGTIFFWGTSADFALARRMAETIKASGHQAFTRDASVFAGDVEPCEKVVLLPSVAPQHAKRISTAYAYAKIVIEHADGTKPVPVPDPTLKVRPLNEKLRRLTNRELRTLARERGIDIERARDRATIIAAIEAAAKGSPP